MRRIWVDDEFARLLKKRAVDEDLSVLSYTRQKARKNKKGGFNIEFEAFW